MRALLLIPFLALVGCGNESPKKGAKNKKNTDTGDPGFIPPSACPTGDLALTQGQVDADLALLEVWNEVRLADGVCDGNPQTATNALTTNEALMWTARCWADDLSRTGAPPAPNQFSDGTTLDDVATAMGFAGFLHTWAVVGGVDEPADGYTQWVEGGGDSCVRLWAEGTLGATASSDAGGNLVVVRLSALDPS